ncbi:membrane or secreted protein [Mucilaginibacter sp. HMF7410]|uniref:Membrane or secreted protein n=1 Tax=Mucilaginibacter arboris TaxID=2682090 RepID=A0A7K1SVT6_9SPHI|nr:membrane or secreted protein [Mucilaginibacter arboris]
MIIGAFFCLFSINQASIAQQSKNKPLTYIDKNGRWRWTKGNEEIYLFGVNYTVPFAYGYRSVKALNIDLEKEIDQDVYHLARMGADAFRVHIWDTEITDTAGNLLQNEHLKLFDYLISKLKERNIKIIITPIAFWGNGYPERDEHTAGFSSKYNKGQATVNENAIKAQENYLKQLLQHVNPYTKLNYRDEPDIIAAELNNEPSHSGPKSGVTAYINRLAAAARSIGWQKPLFYNISQSPYYADAVAKSTVNGFSFQWYPTGLVAGHEQKGNFLPNVDRYTIPYDTIPEFKNKAKMVYEFDAADLLQSNMYPAVAKSFKLAGFQWVTQFAYDPLATAYANTEYQTHFLNLAYTPAKAISFLIANRVFHLLPRNKNYGTYPADSTFDVYRVSYQNSLSEMNTTKEFYYSGSTSTAPFDAKKLEHVAGVGSSALIKYPGYGAYFLDKLENGVWRLEVMPDAITIRDPFERPSPSREVVHLQWSAQPMQISLNDIGNDFNIKAVNDGNSYQTTAKDGSFNIKPGTYLLTKKGKNTNNLPVKTVFGTIGLNEFVAAKSHDDKPYLEHQPFTEVSAGKALTITGKAINLNDSDKVILVVNRAFGAPLTLAMERTTPYDFKAVIPEASVAPGILTYRLLVQTPDKKYLAFPGNHSGDPFSWDYLNTDYWQTFVAAPEGNLTLFNTTTDRTNANPYFPGFGRNGGIRFIAGEETGQLTLNMSMPKPQVNQAMGMQLFVGDKLQGRKTELASFTRIIVRARKTAGLAVPLRIALINKNAQSYAAYVDLSSDFKNIEIPLTAFKPDSSLLLPRPYPGFMPLWFKASSFNSLNISNTDKLEITINTGTLPQKNNEPLTIEVEKVWLQQ